VLWDDVLKVLDALQRAGIRHWVAGGWGVDALVGAETRRHRDLDLMVDADDHVACMATLAGLGYTVETDWLPVRVELVAGGDRWVDVHPVRFDAQGNGLQGDPDGTHFRYPPAGFVVARLGDRDVPCMSAAEQERAHTGYELRPQDEHDLRQLAALRASEERRNVAP
jgi:lincosamide nucleotidyltransferase A/C/D/E